MKMIEYQKSKVLNGFWKEKQQNNLNITTWAIWNRFHETGRIQSFDFDWKDGMDNKPHIFWDSDVAKWMEAVAYIMYHDSVPELEEHLESLIDKIENNQGEDGYFNVFFSVCEPQNRFQGRTNHELYCAGHLIEAAVAYYESTGRDRFLNAMRKYSDYIYTVFVDEKSAKFTTPGHEEIELALVRLYRCCGDVRYLDLARFFIDERGQRTEKVYDYALPEYAQSHLPVRKQRTAEGHAVRACYLYTGMALLAKEIQDQELFEACKDIFFDVVDKKMFITGGIGSTYVGEAFTVPYDLPNDVAYNETCASIAMCLFARAMQELDNSTIYADIIERELYNGMMSGLSLSANAFFYENPLEINRRNYIRNASTIQKERYPITKRKKVFETSCCPPNINRTIASIQRYIYGIDDDAVYVHQFISSELNLQERKVLIETNYPADGHVRIKSKNVPILMIRIPAWCEQYTVNCQYEVVGNYLRVAEDDVSIDFQMKPILLESNPLVYRNIGKVAVQYGPVVYCAESIDNDDDVYALFVDPDAEIATEYCDEYQLNILKMNGWRKKKSDKLYQPISNSFEPARITMIPYSCHANRGDTDMLVWLNVKL